MSPSPQKITEGEALANVDEHVATLFAGARRRAAGASMDFYDWVVANYYIRKRPIAFDEWYKPLVGIYRHRLANPGAQKLVVRKAAQIGVSEHNVARTFYLSGELGLIGMYVFPKKEQMGDFSRGRVKPRINDSPTVKALISDEDADNVFMKMMTSGGIVYFRGSQNYDSISAVDADFILLDEVDRFFAPHIEVVQARVSNSEYKFEIYTSTPTYPGFGISKMYGESDRRRWFVKCPRCGEQQTPEYESNIEVVQETEPFIAHFVCAKCRKRINLKALDGEWVAEYPGREVAGFFVNKLIAGRTLASELVFKDKTMRNRADFFNQWLGREYKPPGAQLDITDIEGCIATGELAYTAPVPAGETGTCVAGFDVGAYIHYVVVEQAGGEYSVPRVVDAGTLGDGEYSDRDVAEVVELIERYNLRMFVIDALPHRRFSQRLIDEFRGRSWAVIWGTGAKFLEFIRTDTRKRVIDVNRNVAFDGRTELIKHAQVALPMNIEARAPGFNAQMVAQYKIKEESDEGEIKYKYVNAGEADHYGDAFVYGAVLAMEMSAAYYPSAVYVVSDEGVAEEQRRLERERLAESKRAAEAGETPAPAGEPRERPEAHKEDLVKKALEEDGIFDEK